MAPHLPFRRLIFGLGILGIFLPSLQAADEIILQANAGAGVELFGLAKIVKAKGQSEESEVQLGKWNKENLEEAKVIFTPEVPQDGFYDVYVKWFTGSITTGFTKNLPVTVKGAKGESTRRFTQQLGNVWAFLGTHEFKAGKTGQIIADATGTFGLSSINAVKLVPASVPPATQKPKNIVAPKGAPDAFDKLRLRMVDLMTPALDTNFANPVVAEKVGQHDSDTYLLWKTMQKGEGIKELWADFPVGRDISKNEGGGSPLVLHYRRLMRMAAAYVSSSWPLGYGEKMQGNPELLADVIYGLEFFYKYRFNEQTKNKMGADWIANEMNQPQAILEIILLVHPNVKEDFIQKQIATMERMHSDPRKMYGGGGTSTGFNRLGFVYVHVLRGIVQRDKAHIDMALDAIWDQFDVNDRANPLRDLKGTVSADGFYEDGSFIQHGDLPYMPIYGANVLNIFASLNDLLKDSPWELNNPKAEVLNEWIYKGVEPLIYKGDHFYRATGRSVGQSYIQNNGAAYRMMDSLARMVPSAKPENKKVFEGMIKAWMQDDYLKNAYRWNNYTLKMPVVLEIERIINDPSIQPRPRPLGPRVFYNTDYVVYHQPGYAASLSMSSTRIATHEMMQGVNNRGWYQADGTLFVHTPDPLRYNGDFWPTINPYRLPGITVDTQTRKEGDSGPGQQGKRSSSPWGGGVQLGDYAMASMGLAAQESTLTAQKAWFFFGDQIVCLGSAIKSTDNRTIETIVENAKLNIAGDNAFVVDGKPQPANLGWGADLPASKWAFLAGSFPGADMGWIFPDGSNLKALREARTGKWQDIFSRDKEMGDKTNNFLTLWYDHGTNPSSATYAYIILPGMKMDDVKAYAAKPAVDVVANSDAVQAVSAPGLGLRGANFWSAGSAAGITSSGKAAVLVLEKDGKVTVAVSDPTQLEQSVEIALDLNASRALKADEHIKVVSISPLKLSIELKDLYGKTVSAEFSK